MKHRFDQKFKVPSPLRPQTTMAIEKLNMAAKDAQPRVCLLYTSDAADDP